MIVLGILILLVVAVVTATVLANGDDPASLDMVGLDVETTLAGVYAIGALNLLLAVLGVVLLLGGLRRSRKRRKEVKSLRKQADNAPAGAPADRDPAPVRDRERGEDETTMIDRDRELDRRRGHRDGDDHFDSTPRD